MKPIKKITVPKLTSYKKKHRKLVIATAYDATFATLIDQSGVDAILVGDSLGMVIQGHENTIPVTVDDIVYHCRAVARGTQRAHIVGDMPFTANKMSSDKTLEDAARIIQKGHAESVKLEGGAEMAKTISRIVTSGIPVMGHVGMTPQSVHAFGGFKTQGKSAEAQKKIFDDAVAVAEAGAYAVVLEGIPSELAEEITHTVSIPTIGIGAGMHCDGQVLVCYDLLGMYETFRPKFVKQYAQLGMLTKKAVSNFADEVRNGQFPGEEHSTFLEK
ncbi:MAG: 3-methyl-2-oxobutanoate hydroxymethyltransferase [Deltaproteobacteria bacterium]|nr:3-methyl-2-oxobutanoate hydroxymethyltransferase [Deltaproteobacteria bacterium]MBN2673600.1 3-methyl-2-oxobutanoate hydroxymethyltransferase [Deltaproteobacteria bacterium]